MKPLATTALIVALTVSFLGPTSAHDTFVRLHFSERTQYDVVCAAHYECDIELEPDETVNDGYNANIADWDPHIGYQGDAKRHIPLTPHLIMRPQRAGLRTNIVLTTSRRTYYLYARSTADSQPTYYSFQYDDETFKSLANLAVATQTALRADGSAGGATPSPTPTPAIVADLNSVCFDYNYSYQIDPDIAPNHQPGQKPSNERLPAKFVPRVVCTDGQHTFVEFPKQRETPSDIPVTFALTDEGDTLNNYTYNSEANRYTIDGVYETFIMELGSQYEPLRVKVFHDITEPSQTRSAHPIKISTPMPSAAIAPSTTTSVPSPSPTSPLTTAAPSPFATSIATVAPVSTTPVAIGMLPAISGSSIGKIALNVPSTIVHAVPISPTSPAVTVSAAPAIAIPTAVTSPSPVAAAAPIIVVDATIGSSVVDAPAPIVNVIVADTPMMTSTPDPLAHLLIGTPLPTITPIPTTSLLADDATRIAATPPPYYVAPPVHHTLTRAEIKAGQSSEASFGYAAIIRAMTRHQTELANNTAPSPTPTTEK